LKVNIHSHNVLLKHTEAAMAKKKDKKKDKKKKKKGKK
jgi:hypothetical protein